jgi:hypothetical protein
VKFLPILGAFAKLRKGDCELRRVRPSVRPSVCPHWIDFHGISYFHFFSKFGEKMQG